MSLIAYRYADGMKSCAGDDPASEERIVTMPISSRRSFNSGLATLGLATWLGKSRSLFAQSTSPRFEPIPPDLPLPGSRPSQARWIREARVLQPWGKTQYLALVGAGEKSRRLKQDYGFNVLMVLPPPAHNAITAAEYHLTEDQFQKGIDAYRRAGYALMLYSSIIHCGHAPQWQFGEIEREHPDWSQLDADGNRVTGYGHAWICPNSPGLEYTLGYTEGLVKQYHPQAVMIDDNGFDATKEGGWSCYCRYCHSQFHEYVVRRCGAGWLERQLGLKAASIKIPAQAGPLYALWVHWRNRVWARANETFRKRLRQVDPSIVFFANTLYDYPTAEQSSDLQYDHEDVIFSESHHMDSWYMSEKMLYGKAIAANRSPLWNYVATFEDSDFDIIRPTDVTLPMLASSLAHGGLPWIVYRGFHKSFNQPTLEQMSSLMSWYSAHSDFYEGEKWAPVAALVSTESRNALGQPLLPTHISFLLEHGVPLALVRADHMPLDRLQPFQVVTAETCQSMSQGPAEALARWTKAGGKLIAHADVAAFDEIGRRRPHSLLWTSLGLSSAPKSATKSGRGQIFTTEPEEVSRVQAGGQAAETSFGRLAFEQVRDLAFGLPTTIAEVVAYRQPRRILLHLVQHIPYRESVTVTVPSQLCAKAKAIEWHRPGQQGSPLSVATDQGRLKIAMPHLLPYSVVEIKI